MIKVPLYAGKKGMLLWGQIVITGLQLPVAPLSGQTGNGDHSDIAGFSCSGNLRIGENHFRDRAPAHMGRFLFDLFLLLCTMVCIQSCKIRIDHSASVFHGLRQFYHIIGKGGAGAGAAVEESNLPDAEQSHSPTCLQWKNTVVFQQYHAFCGDRTSQCDTCLLFRCVVFKAFSKSFGFQCNAPLYIILDKLIISGGRQSVKC